MSKFRKLQQLSRDERRLLAQAGLFLPLTLVGVRAFGVSRWQSVLAKLAQVGKKHPVRSCAGEAISSKAAQIATMVNVAAQHGIFRVRCLQRSLVLWSLLARNGIESEVRYGARKENGQIQAHAWVEINGVVLYDDEHRDFSILEELTASESRVNR